jgi:NAD+ synthase
LSFDKDILKIDCEKTQEQLTNTIITQIRDDLKKTGAVIGISGGVDSSLCAALCAKALGPDRVLGVLMPEQDSSPDSRELALELAARFGFETVTEVITDGLSGMHCYERRDEAIRQVFPNYNSKWKSKIVISGNILDSKAFNFFKLEVEDESGQKMTKRLPRSAYLQVVAASNLKQRLRMTTLYYQAERLNWAVIGTGNKDEHMQGFFVKYGDGGADLKPIAHLFKVQVFELARHLGVPESILERIPTTDTYSAECTQEEFFFGLDFYNMDMIWYAMENDIPAAKVAEVLGLTTGQIERAVNGIQRKIIATEYLRAAPLEMA